MMEVSKGEDTIKVNDSLIVKVGDVYSKYQNHYKFLLQTNIDPYTGYPFPKEQEDNEKNNENNSYEAVFTNYK